MRKGLFKTPNIEPEFKVNSTIKPKTPENIYTKCDFCKSNIITSKLEENNRICPKCGGHFRLSARQRLELICDSGSFCEMFAEIISSDPLDFPSYKKKLEDAKKDSGENEGVVTGVCNIDNHKCAIFVMEAKFMMGSMGCAVGEKITRIFEYATENYLPLVGFTLSGGARMQEGILSLMQMAKTSCAVAKHSEKGLLYIAILCDPTTGGVTASFAMEADIIIAEPNALIAFAGPRVIEQTIRQKLPSGFQKAEFLYDKGFVDRIVNRNEQRQLLSQILMLHNGGK